MNRFVFALMFCKRNKFKIEVHKRPDEEIGQGQDPLASKPEQELYSGNAEDLTDKIMWSLLPDENDLGVYTISAWTSFKRKAHSSIPKSKLTPDLVWRLLWWEEERHNFWIDDGLWHYVDGKSMGSRTQLRDDIFEEQDLINFYMEPFVNRCWETWRHYA